MLSEFAKELIQQADGKDTPKEFIEIMVDGAVSMMLASAKEGMSKSELAATVCRMFADMSLYSADHALTGGKGVGRGVYVRIQIDLPEDYDSLSETQH